ncbi:MAG TPA: diguanylate cyclase [Albitalea sp.]|nr:diguanylate cyclase [Albitalea sp.]
MPSRLGRWIRRTLLWVPARRAGVATAATVLTLVIAATAGAVWAWRWPAGLTVGALVLAVGLAWLATRPLARAVQHMLDQRRRRRMQTEGLVHQLQAVLDNAQVGIVFTRDGRFELVSQHFCDTFGWERSQLIGQPTRLIYASDAAFKSFGEQATPQFIQRGRYAGEVQLIRQSGEVLWVQARGRAVVPGDPTQGTIWILDDVTQERAQRERLAWSASHDSLTGLVNRAEFERALAQAMSRAGRHAFCALFIDLDRFKQVNDNAGHAAGDAVLRDVAQQFTRHVRHTDIVARLGGDEFAVLLHRCPPPKALTIAEQLRAAVERYELTWEGKRYSVGASIGLVPLDGSFATPAEVMRAADAACYSAKREGRNRVTRYEPQMMSTP